MDQQDVVGAKRGLLRQLAAEVPPAMGEDSEPSTPTGARTSSGLARHLRWARGQAPCLHCRLVLGSPLGQRRARAAGT